MEGMNNMENVETKRKLTKKEILLYVFLMGVFLGAVGAACYILF